MDLLTTHPVYTLPGAGKIVPGAHVERLRLSGAGVEIDAITVGERGRGRELAILPVDGLPRVPCSDRGQKTVWGTHPCGACGAQRPDGIHPDTGEVLAPLAAASVGQTRSERPKLIAAAEATDRSAAILALRSPMGYRGGNEHTGDHVGWWCCCGSAGDGPIPTSHQTRDCAESPACSDRPRHVWAPRPGRELARGRVAQGDAGRMGSGDQIVLLLPEGQVLRVSAYTDGRRPAVTHYYLLIHGEMISATWAEREASEVF